MASAATAMASATTAIATGGLLKPFSSVSMPTAKAPLGTPLLPAQSAPQAHRLVPCHALHSTTPNAATAEAKPPAIGKAATALALAAIIAGTSAEAALADISGLTPCKDSKAFAKREKQSLKKLQNALKNYDPESAPALAIKATIEKTKRRFENYGKQGLLCGTDGLPHLIVNGDQAHWGEFITPGLLFLYIAGWIGWVGRSYLISIRGEKKPRRKEIIIDVPLASRLLWRGFIWPLAAVNEFRSGNLVEKEANITVSPR